ncbi:MAG: hypothetical protein NTZ75_07345 [Euryarchaeota archaeon]|jgi:hypothetical protein|nr:hypothetical protein [Euryarchaeota archaeon]
MKSDETLENHKIEIKPPTKCNNEKIFSFCSLVKKGEEVDFNTLEYGVKRARFLGFYYVDDKLVGVAALKNANPGYQNNVFERAGKPELAKNFRYEIGYAFTDDEYRCMYICRNLIRHLIAKEESENIFSTARSENIAMRKILNKLEFKEIGDPFLGRLKEKGEYYVQLFVKFTNDQK